MLNVQSKDAVTATVTRDLLTRNHVLLKDKGSTPSGNCLVSKHMARVIGRKTPLCITFPLFIADGYHYDNSIKVTTVKPPPNEIKTSMPPSICIHEIEIVKISIK